ncbi:MAG: MarR family winged helix-turn-helix transcriptional regulator [Chloroflexota bacterium]
MGTKFKGTIAERAALNAYIKLSRASEAVNQQINDHLREHQLTISQFGVLEALYHLGPLQPRQLGSKILKSSGNMTLVIDNLVKRKLVKRERREDDRRRVDINLTEKGYALVANILPSHVEGVVETFSALSDTELVIFGDLCKKLGLSVPKILN